MNEPDLSRLDDFFAEADLKWKPIAVSKKTGKALAGAYIDNRAIQSRLDDVCGKAGWRNEYAPGPGGGVICGLSIKVGGEWVTKWDGAENTDIESVKGGLSDSMRRAGSMWGIGRYLYDLPSAWVPIDAHGKLVQTPTVPAAFLPGPQAEGWPSRNRVTDNKPVHGRISQKKARDLQAAIQQLAGLSSDEVDDFIYSVLGRSASCSDLNADEATTVYRAAEGQAEAYKQP